MSNSEFNISLTLRAPVLSHAIGSLALGVDMAMQRHRGQPALNGSQVRGVLRHTLEYFTELLAEENRDASLRDDIRRWFGARPKQDDTDFEPRRAQLSFDYAWRLAGEPVLNEQPRYRIGIDDASGAVAAGNLQVIEAPFQVGEEPEFTGSIRARMADEAEAQRLELWLNRALQHIAGFGALKSNGFGKLERFAVLRSDLPAKRDPIFASHATRLSLVLKLDRPLCIAKPHRPNDNQFQSESFIPGAAMIGALARAGKQLQSEQISALRVLHALPLAKDGQRSAPLPLSLAHYDGWFCDLALQKEPGPQQIDGHWQAPEFDTDWKDKHWAGASDYLHQQKPGWPLADELKRHLLVRTAIEAGSGTAAEGLLFSQDCVDHWDAANGEPLPWLSEIDLSEIADEQRAEVLRKLGEQLGDSLVGLGKTKARAALSPGEPLPALPRSPLAAEQGVHVITLRTAARLLRAEVQLPGCNGHQVLHDAYAEYWDKASGGKLALSHYYARQQLAGGEFYWRHYRKGRHYQPEWLTVPGSVFVLQAVGNEIEGILQHWLDKGLEPEPAADWKNDDWQSDPYIRQNGYGEVIVDHPIHWAGACPEEAGDE